MSNRIIVVFGATGKQGGSVLNAILVDGTFTPRAITRDPTTEKARKLKDQGVEVVKGDLGDLESLKAALKGSECVFGVTDYWTNVIAGNAGREITQGKALVDAAESVGVKFLVWSGLPDVVKISDGKFTDMVQYTNKVAIEEYLRASGVPSATIHTGWFAENFWATGNLHKLADGNFELHIPVYGKEQLQSFTWVSRDVGASVLALFKNYDTRKEEVLGQTFVVATQRLTHSELAAVFAKGLGKDVEFFTTTGMPKSEILSMYEFMVEHGQFPKEQRVPDARLVALGVTFGTLEEFIEENKERLLTIPVAK